MKTSYKIRARYALSAYEVLTTNVGSVYEDENEQHIQFFTWCSQKCTSDPAKNFFIELQLLVTSNNSN